MQSIEDSIDGVELTASDVANPSSPELQQQQSPKQNKQQSSNELSSSQIELFLTMHNRKLTRELNGPQKKKTKYHLVILLCFLILVYGLSSTYATTNPNNGEEGNTSTGTGGNQQISITLTISQIVLIGLWIFVAIVITAIFGSSKFIHLLYWMLVYWPLLLVLASALVNDVLGSDTVWIVYMFIAAEVLTLVVFVCVNYIYPRFVTSSWFQKNGFARKWWRIRLLHDGVTMEYDGLWGRFSRKRYECRYIGEVNEDGLPHGKGVWSDDSYNGEILTGTWNNGHPVAPFSSRQYGGKGNTFAAVKLAFFMANDDTFEANKFMPTNDERPRCGVASVECSIAGDFMSNLPMASLIGDIQVEGEDGVTIGKLCKHLDDTSDTSLEEEEAPVSSLQISTNDPRGVQIDDHVYELTGLSFTKRIKQIVIDVIRTKDDEPTYTDVATDEESPPITEEQKQQIQMVSTTSDESGSVQNIRLQVRDWTNVRTKDALVFIPGFNSWLQHSLETFGQMVAMTKLSQKVYPVLFDWPGAQVLTYRYASLISASENNRKYFLQMLQSLKAEGITNIHIVTHSMGVQTLMNVFEDNSDGSPSAVSQCFGQAPSLQQDDVSSSVANLDKLVCRSITMLNPDYPLKAFNEHGFQTLRRVTSLVTVVGDSTDQALWWSSFINGCVNTFGWSQPSALDYEARTDNKGMQDPLGRKIDSLYVDGSEDLDETIEFQNGENATSSRGDNEALKVWLDCDVIDTTGLDTNVNDLRHSAYSVNSILLRDIEDIVVTGKRASDRSTLLHKSGNVYEYCHAPSFVSF